MEPQNSLTLIITIALVAYVETAIALQIRNRTSSTLKSSTFEHPLWRFPSKYTMWKAEIPCVANCIGARNATSVRRKSQKSPPKTY